MRKVYRFVFTLHSVLVLLFLLAMLLWYLLGLLAFSRIRILEENGCWHVTFATTRV
jgi:hypothetical protein